VTAALHTHRRVVQRRLHGQQMTAATLAHPFGLREQLEREALGQCEVICRTAERIPVEIIPLPGEAARRNPLRPLLSIDPAESSSLPTTVSRRMCVTGRR